MNNTLTVADVIALLERLPQDALFYYLNADNEPLRGITEVGLDPDDKTAMTVICTN